MSFWDFELLPMCTHDVMDIVGCINLTMNRDEARGVEPKGPIYGFAHVDQVRQAQNMAEWLNYKEDLRARTSPR